MTTILLVENNQATLGKITEIVEQAGFQSLTCSSVSEALEFNLEQLDAIICNLRLPDSLGTELIKHTSTPVLITSNFASLRSAISTSKSGAMEYLSIPFETEEVLTALKAITTEPNKIITNANEEPVPGMVGSCPTMKELFRRIRKVALTNSSVLIQGESGTGKELVARALHEASSRNDSNLISINCAAIPENLIESELFGHEKGSFIGATTTRTGLIEAANNGTLFLDEIGELPLEAQARLLRVLQEHEIRKVGSVESTKVDVRLVAATHRNLQQFVEEGRFREDLFYRINVMPLDIPPLRERGADILELVDKKLKLICNRLGMETMHFSADSIQAITMYPWPGNIRELENAIERAVILTEGSEIPIDLLGINVELIEIDSLNIEQIQQNQNSVIQLMENANNKTENIDDDPIEDLSLEDYFQRFVLDHQDSMNETQLAKKLGISRKCLWERRQRFGIPRQKKSL
ncbi:sigma-54-dependent Fis family transcriptional regulator [Haliea sp. AH-315-K21]|uniref:Response regulator n=1 Tax=SAR86 cluster bacterium TaxID=2030880 RepID=A0A2A5C9W5_9GAMM|nr:sigma-54-dependent Fis family transcriptional regulator [Haliea sp. AH-315-K21]MBN4075544.1 sigma-54-dependent Fis family transcriptional regulator [Gammaproteobacteria bacterium AH-315-E17]PCJ40602.1 MAG: response regulator [SAR86 cluster bacterium]